jgi:hypothetical protein
LVVALAGCAGPDLRAAVERGQAEWVRACGVRPEPLAVLWQAGKRCGPSRTAVGCTRAQTVVSVWRGVEPAMLDAVVLHELGHVLGAGHVPPGEGVMSARVSEASVTITAADRAAVCPDPRAYP